MGKLSKRVVDSILDVRDLSDQRFLVYDVASGKLINSETENVREHLLIESGGTLTVRSLLADSGVYTNGTNILTSIPPSSGTLGYWDRTGTTLSPANGEDSITVSGIKVGDGAASRTTSAGIEISSTTKALLLSSMTTAERDALTAIDGMIVYNTTTNAFNFYENGSWVTK
jgi:hypothetical protein